MESQTNLPELMSRKQVAKFMFGCSPNTFDKYYLSQPDFPVIEIRGMRRYPKSQILKWINNHTKTIEEVIE